MIHFWNTYLIPSETKIYEKADIISKQLERWSDDDDDYNIICLQEVFKWRVGLLSKCLLIPLSKFLKSHSRILLGLSIYDGKYQISNILFLIISIIILFKKKFKTLASITLVVMIQNIFMGHFDTLKILTIPDKYKKNIHRSEKDNLTGLLDGGQVTMSTKKIMNKKEINFKDTFPGLENSFIKTTICIDNKPFNIYNLHLSPTFYDNESNPNSIRRSKMKYGFMQKPVKLREKLRENKFQERRTLQIKQLGKSIKKDENNIILGDFNICKFKDNKEYKELVDKMSSYGLVQIKPELDQNQLVQGGTYQSLKNEAISKKNRTREYLDYVFISNGLNKMFTAKFQEEFTDLIDHKYCEMKKNQII